MSKCYPSFSCSYFSYLPRRSLARRRAHYGYEQVGNTRPAHFAKPDELQWLLPVFWIGFNIALFPASVVVKHRGALIVMGAAGLMGALAILGAEIAGALNTLILAQFIAGAAWGCRRPARSSRGTAAPSTSRACPARARGSPSGSLLSVVRSP